MKVRRYEKKDFPQIQKWLSDREFPIFSEDLLPPFGQIVDGVTAGFVIETDNNFAMLDFWVANPNARLSERLYGSMAMLEGALERIRERNFSFIVSNTKRSGGVKMALRYGFEKDPNEYFFFRKLLTESDRYESHEMVRRYEPSHYEMIHPWICETGEEWIAKVSLPKIGFVVDGIACLFMIRTDANVAFLDCFATNHHLPLIVRVEGAKAVLETAISHAEREGVKVLMGSTRSVKASSLFSRYGFSYDPDPYIFIRKDMTKETEDERSRSSKRFECRIDRVGQVV